VLPNSADAFEDPSPATPEAVFWAIEKLRSKALSARRAAE
jgi:xanthine dehydrogenase molybdopterin-binding subunit B